MRQYLKTIYFLSDCEGGGVLTKKIFGENWETFQWEIINLAMKNIFDGGQYVTRDNFELTTGIPITNQQLCGLRGLYDTARIKFGQNLIPNKKCISLRTFLSSYKKGSRKFRGVLLTNKIDTIPHNMIKFTENVEIVINTSISKTLNKCWNFSYFANGL